MSERAFLKDPPECADRHWMHTYKARDLSGLVLARTGALLHQCWPLSGEMDTWTDALFKSRTTAVRAYADWVARYSGLREQRFTGQAVAHGSRMALMRPPHVYGQQYLVEWVDVESDTQCAWLLADSVEASERFSALARRATENTAGYDVMRLRAPADVMGSEHE